MTVGLTVERRAHPTGLGYAAFVPLIEAGFVDWIVSTGANLYHDMHRSLGFSLYGISPQVDDVALRRDSIIRIYDIIFDAEVLFKTDDFVSEVLKSEEFQKRMSTAELHWRLGRYVREREKLLERLPLPARRRLRGRRAGVHLQPGGFQPWHGPGRAAPAGFRGRLRSRAGRQ